MGLLQVLHEHGHHHIDQDKLGHKDKHNKEEWSNIRINTTVLQTLVRVITLLTESVLHDPIPVVSFINKNIIKSCVTILVTCCNPEQSKEGHSKRSKVCMLTQSLAGVFFITFCKKRVKPILKQS